MKHKAILNYHDHFANAITRHMETMPDYFKQEISALKELGENYRDEYYKRAKVKVDENSSREVRSRWTQKADVLIKEIFYLLKGRDEKLIPEYLGFRTLSEINRDIERFQAVNQMLAVNEHPGKTDLVNHIDRLAKLKEDGEIVFKRKSESMECKKKAIRTLNEAKDKWDSQYRKVKHLMRGYFWESEVNYRNFFPDGEKRRGRMERDEEMMMEPVEEKINSNTPK